jgi:hypothetical protein
VSMDPGLEAAWAVLGLAADADRDQVTRAYRRLALSTHPDVSPLPDAAARFAAVTNAYRRVVEAAGGSFTGQAGTDTTTPRQPPSTRGTPPALAEELVWIHVSRPMVHAQLGDGIAGTSLRSSGRGGPRSGYLYQLNSVPIVAGPVQVQPPSDPERLPGGAG